MFEKQQVSWVHPCEKTEIKNSINKDDWRPKKKELDIKKFHCCLGDCVWALEAKVLSSKPHVDRQGSVCIPRESPASGQCFPHFTGLVFQLLCFSHNTTECSVLVISLCHVTEPEEILSFQGKHQQCPASLVLPTPREVWWIGLAATWC